MKVVDADICIDFFRELGAAAEYFELHLSSRVLMLSATTQFELVEGAHDKDELRRIHKFIALFDTVYPDEKSLTIGLDLFSTYHLSRGIDAFDAILAGYALANDAILVTKNVKHYRFIPNLKLEIPY